MPGALDRVRILECSEMIAAPFAGMHLGDMGADIIKVEPPGGDPWRLGAQFVPTESRSFLSLNRNKRDLAVDLKTAEGQAIVHRIVPQMDVVMVNYRPDTPAKLGIDYDTLRAINPRLIYIENTAMGSKGPNRHRPGYDLVAQAVTGLLLSGGRKDPDGMPLPITPALADYGTGLTMAMAVCAALYARERTGVGQKIEATLLATSLAFQTALFIKTGVQARPGREEDASAASSDRATRARNAYYRAYSTKDTMIAVACLTPVLRRKMASAIQVYDPRHDREIPATSEEGRRVAVEFMDAVTERMTERTTAEWLEVFDAVGVPAGEVKQISDMTEDPQAIANGLVVTMDHPAARWVSMVGPVVAMEGTPTAVQSPPPTLGQHNEEILAEFGYSSSEIADLREAGIINAVAPPVPDEG